MNNSTENTEPPPLKVKVPTVLQNVDTTTTERIRKRKPKQKIITNPVTRKDTILLIILALIADQCLYPAQGGLGLACVIICSILGLSFLKFKQINKKCITVSLMLIALSIMMIWHCWWLVVVAGWVSLFLFAIKIYRPKWKMPSALLASMLTLIQAPSRLMDHLLAKHFKKHSDTDQKESKSIRARVILVPLLVCLVFIVIFSAANPVVGNFLDSLLNNIGTWIEQLFKLITPFRIFILLLWLVLFAALIKPVIENDIVDELSSLNDTLAQSDDELASPDGGLVALVTLILVNILFLAYNGLDSIYLYMKAELPAGVTWTSYTHSGCGWLTLALLVSSIVIGCIFRSGLNFDRRVKHLKLWSYVWAVQNAILAVGTVRRIGMYIDFSGLTNLRITGIYGALLIMTSLAIMVYKVAAERSWIWLLRKYVLSFCVAVLILSLTPSNWLCATYNTQSIIQGKKRAMRPIVLKDLAAAALPPLLPLLDYTREDGNEQKEQIVRKGIAGLLGIKLHKMRSEYPKHWIKWQASNSWALKQLEAAEAEINNICDKTEWRKSLKKLKDNHDLTHTR